jgi:hypothetical protein
MNVLKELEIPKQIQDFGKTETANKDIIQFREMITAEENIWKKKTPLNKYLSIYKNGNHPNWQRKQIGYESKDIPIT